MSLDRAKNHAVKTSGRIARRLLLSGRTVIEVIHFIACTDEFIGGLFPLQQVIAVLDHNFLAGLRFESAGA